MNASLDGYGRRRVRISVWFCVAAFAAEYTSFLIRGISFRSWEGEFGTPFVLGAIAGMVLLTVMTTAGFFLAYPALKLLAGMLWLPLRHRADKRLWEERTVKALWAMPYAAAAGAATWLVYSFGRFGGWPDDVIFGAIGIVIGAFCCMPILAAWVRTLRQPADSPEESGCSRGASA